MEIQKGDRIFSQVDIHIVIEEGKSAQAKKQTKEMLLSDLMSLDRVLEAVGVQVEVLCAGK